MPDDRTTTRVQRAIKMQEVPPEKWQTMAQRTVLGTLFVALGLAGAFLRDWSVYISLALVLFGATIWSTQIITASLSALLGPFKAWRRAMKDGTGNG